MEATATTGEVAAKALTEFGGVEQRKWASCCRAVEGTDHGWPDEEAQELLLAVLAALLEDDRNLDAAARAWGRTNPTMPLLVQRLGSLRELLVTEGVVGPQHTERLQRVLDRVTTVATETAMADLHDAALTDVLTGVGNRRALEAAARPALAAAGRTATPLSVVVIDLDGLKAINDAEGHAAGDRALAGLSASLRAAMRDTDQLFRVGGDEFVALLPLVAADGVDELMQRAAKFNAPRFSFGAAGAPLDGGDLDTLVAVADRRLYEKRRRSGYYDRAAAAPPVAPEPPVPVGRRWVAPAAAVGLAGAVVAAFFAFWPSSATPPASRPPAVHGTNSPARVGGSPAAPTAGPGVTGQSTSVTAPGGRSTPTTGPGSDQSGTSAPTAGGAAPSTTTSSPAGAANTTPITAPPQQSGSGATGVTAPTLPAGNVGGLLPTG